MTVYDATIRLARMRVRGSQLQMPSAPGAPRARGPPRGTTTNLDLWGGRGVTRSLLQQGV
jgi:hypothetical protein